MLGHPCDAPSSRHLFFFSLSFKGFMFLYCRVTLKNGFVCERLTQVRHGNVPHRKNEKKKESEKDGNVLF